MWSQSLAVGHELFVEDVKAALDINAQHCAVVEVTGDYLLREPAMFYNAHFDSKTGRLSQNKGYFLGS